MNQLPMPLLLALLMSVGAVCQWLAWRTKLPAILYLLIVGLIVGQLVGSPADIGFTDELLFPFVSLGVAVILFEGSLTLHLSEARGVSRIIRNLVTIGVLVTSLCMALAAHWLIGLNWEIAFLFGAIVSVTGPTVIVPMLRSMQPSARVANILRWEGILIDPIGALLAVLVYEVIVAGQQADAAEALLRSLGSGVVLGLAGALLLGQAIKRHWAPEYLLNYLSLALVLLVFASANAIEHESGLLAVTVMGIMLANMRDVHMEDVLDFKEHLTLVLVSLLFIMLAARMNLDLLKQIGWSAVGLLLIAQFLVRPLSVALSSLGTAISLKEAALLSWVAPRGIVAAAVSALFALRLETQGVVGADLLAPAVFVIIVGTVVLQSGTARFVAERLGLSQAKSQGLLIVGANQVAIKIAEALKAVDIRVVIADDNWAAINEARMAGFGTYFGNPLSEHADRHLELSGLTRLLIMSRRPDYNALVFSRFRPEFGVKHIYSLYVAGDESKEVRGLAGALRAQRLFGDNMTWSKLASLIAQGGEIKSTGLTDTFDFSAYQELYGNNALPLFALNEEGRLRVFTDKAAIEPKSGWSVIALIASEENAAKAA